MNNIARFTFLLSMSIWPLATMVHAEVTDAHEIFKSIEPSVVLITDLESSGSGIVLSEDGLILTNFHVANTPLPQQVEAIVTLDGRQIKKTFDKVQLFKVHNKSDLALLKVDAGNCKFKPSRLSKSEKDTLVGATCFAIGYPYVTGQEKPVITITKGIISSAHRVVNQSSYIQLDAAINPGNSGGALVNEKGVIIGIPTLKFDGVDRIGLATPLVGLKMDQFVNVDEKKGNAEEAARLSGLASQLVLSDALSFGSDPDAVMLAVFLQREALTLEPNNAQWSYNIASMYYRLRKYEQAAAYAEVAVKKSPNKFFHRSLLAECQDLLKKPEEAMKNRMACLSLPVEENEKEQKFKMMAKLANSCLENQDPARALYILSWSTADSKTPLSLEQKLIMQTVEQALPEKTIQQIMAKKSGHSMEDMEAFVKQSPVMKDAVKRDPIAPADISKILPESTVSVAQVSELSLKPDVTAEIVDSPAGVIYDKSLKTVTWTPPPFSKIQSIQVLFLLRNPDGSEEPYIHTISRK